VGVRAAPYFPDVDAKLLGQKDIVKFHFKWLNNQFISLVTNSGEEGAYTSKSDCIIAPCLKLYIHVLVDLAREVA
jgi:hypothetical protein